MSKQPRGRRPLVADRRAVPRKAKPKPSTRKKVKRARKPVPKRGPLRRLLNWALRLLWWITSRAALVGALFLALAVGYQYTTLPAFESVLDGRAHGSVTLQDRHGEVFAWRGDQFGGAVSAGSVSPHLKNAVIATEDKRFYTHFGLSPRGIASAVRINLREGRGPLSGHGGSTITQQTAKLLCLGREYVASEWASEAAYVADCRRGNVQRKAREAIYALAMELKYSKDEILSIYLNRAYMGGGAYGAEAAMQRYFGKPAAAASASEAAMLAGLLTAPSRFAPTSNLERSQNRAATVLRLMQEQGYLTQAQEERARQEPAELSAAAEQKAGGAFADWVMASGPEVFLQRSTADVVIKTTLDQNIQAAAEAGMREVFNNKVRQGSKAQAAVVVMSADGAVRAMVGGRDFDVVGGFNRATQAFRQPGSAFKPFVYAAALDLGYGPLDVIMDEPSCWSIPGSGRWCPENYDRKFRGPVTLTQALQKSLNVPAVKLAESVGTDLVEIVAVGFGAGREFSNGLAMALGASESSPMQMAGAYAGILNGGSAVEPYGLETLSIVGDSEPLMQATGGIRERIIQDRAARELIWMMEKVVSEGTGRRAQFGGWQIAGKTGTTQAARDAWFIGFTSEYVAAVWMGYDDNTPLTGVTGSGLPAEIWREVMLRVHADLEPRPLPMPASIDPGPQTPQVQRRQTRDTAIERILNDLFSGGGGGGTRSQQDPSEQR